MVVSARVHERGAARVRLAKAGDVAALARIHVESWHHTYREIIAPHNLVHTSLARSEARFRGYFWHGGQDLSLLHVLEASDGRLLGYVNSGLSNSRRSNSRRSNSRRGNSRRGNSRLGVQGEVYELYLLPQAQGQGAGRKLLSAALWGLAARRLTPVVVWALADNHRARRFYERMRGRETTTGTVEVGDQRLRKVAYVWSDYLPWPEH